MNEQTEYYAFDKDNLFRLLGSSSQGLTSAEAEKRLVQYGKNVFTTQKSNSLLWILFSQFLSPLIFILLFAASITFYLHEIIETVVILLAVLINILFSTYQEYKAENTIESLRSLIKNKATVLRDGLVREIEAEDLTIGDIIILNYGSQIPADSRVLEANDLKLDESILTGESLPVEKKDSIIETGSLAERENFVFSGTLISNGNGRAIVTHIGNNTEVGKIAQTLTNTEKVLTPVQTAIKNISWYIFVVAMVMVSFIFVLGAKRGESVFDMLVLSSAVAVGVVPEALPISLTVILAIGVLNIAKKGGLVRKLAAAETLGSASLILTDKTGTITEGKLTLNNIFTVDDLKNHGINRIREENLSNLNPSQEHILVCAYKNITATVEKTGVDKNSWVYNGNAFETIILKSLHDFNVETENIFKNKLILPFNSSNKYSVSEDHKESIVLGAPDVIIENSIIDEDEKSIVLGLIEKLGESGKRLVGVGRMDSVGLKGTKISGVEIIGFFSFSDPIRKHVKENIKFIQTKGIKVKIISGDLPGTAKYIGEQVGINTTDSEILSGTDLRNLSDEDLLKIIPNIKIFSRVTPEDKLRIGRLYQSLGEIVAMTGDGVNDSPALKAMDIGISLASGSDVAKSASDMILISNDFKTITETINEGHNIKSNIQKVFIYLMSTSFDAVFIVTGSLIFGLALPLTALQIIWVNILNGTLPALAFAYDKNSTHLKYSKKIFDLRVKTLAIGLGIFSSLLLFVLYYLLSIYIHDIKLVQSVFFLCFAVYVLVISYSFKNLDKPIFKYNVFDNMRLNVANVIGLVLIFLTVYTSIGQEIFGLYAVPVGDLWILLVWLVLNVVLVEFSKFIFNKNSLLRQ